MDFVCGQDYQPLVPNGSYEAQCVGYDNSFVLGKARKLFLYFRITDPGEHFGKDLFMAFNMPYDRKIRPGSKYYKTWVRVNDHRPPSRNTIMSPKKFLNRVFSIKTRTVRPNYIDGKAMPEEFWYSVIDSIIEVAA
jgi:hypothetical protein